MRFLIGCSEICGLISVYSEALKNMGHQTITVSDHHPFYNYTYTYNFSTLPYDFFTKGKKAGFFVKVFFKISEGIEKIFPDFRRVLILLLLLRKFDVYIYIWQGFVNEKILFRILKFFNKKTVVLFLGDEVRHFSAFSQEFDVSFWSFPAEYSEKPIYPGLLKLRYAEKYADLIYSVPDQMGLAVRPYRHLHLPVAIENFNFINNKRKVPIVLHLPSEPFIKGTDRIMAVLQELKDEGVQFEIIYKSKIPYTEVKKILEDADVLVDEIICHGPGVLALEAMASGCAVATNYLPTHKHVFNPPVCQIDSTNMKDEIRKLITDFSYRQQLIIDGREYVRLNNGAEKILRDILNDLNFSLPRSDYYPTYYKENYKSDNANTSIFKKLDAI